MPSLRSRVERRLWVSKVRPHHCTVRVAEPNHNESSCIAMEGFCDRCRSPAATNGVVLATEKKSPSLLLDTSMIEKVAPICPNIGFVYSGMGPDFRVLVAKARKIAQAYWKVYGEYPPTKVLVQEVAGVMQKATQSG